MLKSSPLILTLILSFAVAPFAFGQTPAPLPELASADWSVKQSKVLNAESNDAVWKFMNDRWGNTDVSPAYGKVCGFQFADLHHSGYLSLVVSYDGGGTADCNYVEIYDKSASGIEERDFQAHSNGAYFDSIQDLGGDGHLELIVDKNFGAAKYTEDGSNCLATQSVIYAWNGYTYVDVSTKYPGYYREQLASLRKQIQSEPDSADTGNVDCARAEADQNMRMLGISRDAGVGDAIRRAGSDNRSDRDFAASVLRDMGVPTDSDADGYVYAKGKEGVIKITKQFKYRPGMFEFKRPRTWPPPSTD